MAMVILAAPVVAQRQRAVAQAPAPRVEIESAQIDFGSFADEQRKELPSAIAVRVFSARAWSLRIVPQMPLTEWAGGHSLTWDRLEWRTRALGYQPVPPIGFVAARGQPTGPAGELITVDLRLAFGGDDPLGRFGGALKIVLEGW
jgi:hypothetical protein